MLKKGYEPNEVKELTGMHGEEINALIKSELGLNDV